MEVNPKTPFAKLGANSEVIVKPKPRQVENKPAENNDLSTDKVSSAPIYCLRVLPREYLSTELLSNEFCSVYVHPKDFINIRLSDNKVVRLSKVQPQQQFHNKETSQQQQYHNKEALQHLHNKENDDKSEMDNKSYSQNIIYVKVMENSNVVLGHAVLCESIRDCLDIENFAIIR